MRKWHVVHEEQQVIRAGGERFVHLGNRRAVLADVARSGSYGAVHPDTLGVSTNPLAPAIVLGRFNSRAVVAAQDVPQRPYAERPGVAYVDLPCPKQHAADGLDHRWVLAEG